MQKKTYQPPPGVYPQLTFTTPEDVKMIRNARKNIKRKPKEEMTKEDVMVRWPSLVAHLICTSLGYCTPGSAANIILDHINNRKNWCEWLSSCHNRQPKPVLELSWKCRHNHKDYMADYKKALGLNFIELITGNSPILASWF